MKRLLRIGLTSLVVLAALAMIGFKYRQYVRNPWTRDGRVRADVVQITPRISGPIVEVPIRDNQFVHKGDLLFRIDPRTFQAAYDQALANLDKTQDQIRNLEQQVKIAEAALRQAETTVHNAAYGITSAKAHFDEQEKDLVRYQALVASGSIARRDFDLTKENYVAGRASLNQAQAQLDKANAAKTQAEAELARAKAALGASGEGNALLREAQAQSEQARLNLEFTRVTAPVDGYVTNLNLRTGSQAVANQPLLALVDTDSYWIAGYFRESAIASIKSGDSAAITLMTYPDAPLSGVVESVGYGIAQADNASGQDLLPSISPTFEWIRLAQRVPVRVRILKKPENVVLRVGSTASVLVMTQ